MTKLVVHADYLRGYAKQLASIDNEPEEHLKRYVNLHYRDTEGITGWLAEVIPKVKEMAEVACGVLEQTTRGLSGTSCALEGAARSYDLQDNESARQIFGTAAEMLPDDYVEVDKPGKAKGSFSHGPTVELLPPEDVRRAPKHREKIHEELDDINPWIKSMTGFDALKWCLWVVEPEWGALERIGEAYSYGEKWYAALAEDVDAGMDVLSAHWTDGDASAAFDHHIREEWLPYLESAALHERVGGDLYMYVAAGIEWLVPAFVEVVGTFARFVERVRDAIREFNAKDYWDAAKELAKAVVALVKLIKDVAEGLVSVTDILDEAVNIGFDGAHLWSDILTGKNKVPALS